ncbi:hypothetical protein Ping_1555 [Psychromonas ingrahamii 37]|uniref:Uncharacterized protein n=1 Tax=Psychromonas ingrahamii (strain DSM 17664 / CCUG 51855 / 37) TaxID=357804 RepID=A1SV45_PSYIN|nr:hypothetical protein [Psychromonas ingrahamii]ABM03360.1 hypothetical protein Ping_1555 [Psychromonas ingrahamii 37]
MNNKKAYIWKLAVFLHAQKMVMSGEELAEHLNRNNFLTSYGTEYQGGRGTYKLIKQTWEWLENDLVLNSEAQAVALAFVKQNEDTHTNKP